MKVTTCLIKLWDSYGLYTRPMSTNICVSRDIKCGKLFCDQGQGDPNYGRLVQFANCKATFYSEPENDNGQVDTGTKCGDEKVTVTLVCCQS